MRDIKFRGKNKVTKEWEIGSIAMWDHEHVDILASGINHNGEPTLTHKSVIPDSVGEYTGLQDMYGIDIFEGDILEDGEYTDTVEWSYSSWRITPCEDYLDSFAHKAIVIGNMYDNPEYMDGAE